MDMCAKSIDITAKTGGSSAIVSLRPNELICNLRALVAVRFEQAIHLIVLIFGGQVLIDVGTIDGKGIIEGVTVHVLFRQLRNAGKIDEGISLMPTPLPRSSVFKNNLLKLLLDDPGTLREILQSDPRIKTLMDENASFRHYLNSDRNMREIFSTIFNPAKSQELSRKRDINIMRMEGVPGGYQILDKLSYFLRQSYDDNVASNYQEIDAGNGDLYLDNSQRGRENKMPLPNPWNPVDLDFGYNFSTQRERLVIDLTARCDSMIKTLRKGDLGKTLQQAKALNNFADHAQRALKLSFRNDDSSSDNTPSTSAASQAPQVPRTGDKSLNIFNFNSNDSRWEQHFQSELLQLDTLGYTDRQRNISALLMSFGDVQTAVKLLDKWNR